ncbi:unnamed protein product [Symbiodinium natans]|uniref:Uncharacterized protein n=1 Tax=Symbiodinium natans TaxID=878477 RepID=A0A812RNK2_9DINO|nr:unnamed protein product [Symbiodinium natans]
MRDLFVNQGEIRSDLGRLDISILLARSTSQCGSAFRGKGHVSVSFRRLAYKGYDNEDGAKEGGYPTWRRQAMEDAYRLLYDEAAASGSQALDRLPEPPTSEEIGFRPLPEALVSGEAYKQNCYAGCFEDQSTWRMYRRRFDYEIYKVNAGGFVAGRKIVSGTQTRSVCAADVASKVAEVLLPDACCVSREDMHSAKGPFLLPKGSRGQPRWAPPMEDEEGLAKGRLAKRQPSMKCSLQVGCVARTQRKKLGIKPWCSGGGKSGQEISLGISRQQG